MVERGYMGLQRKQAGGGGERGREPGVCGAKREREMKEIKKNLGKYVTKKKLEVNVDKTKMMVFNKRKRKSEEN
jgi:hypothetical protein